MNVPLRVSSLEPSTIVVHGAVDLAVLARLPHWLRTLFDPPGRRFRLDLTAVSFLDCAGLRALLAIEDYARAAGGSVEAAGVSPVVTRFLKLLGLPAGSGFLAAPASSSDVLPPAVWSVLDPPPSPDEVFSHQLVWSSAMTEPELAAASDTAVVELVDHLVDRLAAGLARTATGPGTEMLRLHVLDLVRGAADRQTRQAIRTLKLPAHPIAALDVAADGELRMSVHGLPPGLPGGAPFRPSVD